MGIITALCIKQCMDSHMLSEIIPFRWICFHSGVFTLRPHEDDVIVSLSWHILHASRIEVVKLGSVALNIGFAVQSLLI